MINAAVCLGCQQGSANLTLVSRGNPLQCVFESAADMDARFAALQAEQAARAAARAAFEAEAVAKCDREAMDSLLIRGFAPLRALVPRPLVPTPTPSPSLPLPPSLPPPPFPPFVYPLS